MKKKILSAAMAAALVSTSAPAGAVEILKNLRFGGQIDVQATSATNITDFATHADCTARNSDGTCATFGTGTQARNDRIGDAQTRLMLHLDWDLLDDVHSRVTLRKNDRNYGTFGGNTNSNPNSQTVDTNATASVLGETFVDEAFFKVDKIAGQVDATFGQQFSGSQATSSSLGTPQRYGLPVYPLTRPASIGTPSSGVTGVAGKLTGSAIRPRPDDTGPAGLEPAFKGTRTSGPPSTAGTSSPTTSGRWALRPTARHPAPRAARTTTSISWA